MHAIPTSGTHPDASRSPREVRVVYVRYHDPNPLEFPDRPERLPGPIFHAAGVLLREDDEFLALGEIAFAEENEPLVGRYGADLFPAYRNVLTVPKATIVERRDVVVKRSAKRRGGPRAPTT
jgi:hypothetical protein